MSNISNTSLLPRVLREALLMVLALIFASAPFVAAAQANPGTQTGRTTVEIVAKTPF